MREERKAQRVRVSKILQKAKVAYAQKNLRGVSMAHVKRTSLIAYILTNAQVRTTP